MVNSFRFLLLCVFILVSDTSSQWIIQNSGTSVNLRSIYFLNSSTGFACGSSGTLIKTTNGGTNWNPLVSGITSEINSIHFIDPNTGFACANGGNLIMTTNAGANWSPLTSGVTDNLYSISFSGTANGVCSGSGGTLLFTSNGGLNWIVAANGFLSSYYGVFMVSTASAFAGGVNTIFQPLFARTSNGGANWSYGAFYLNSNEGNLRDLYFFTANTGIAVSNVWDGRGGVSLTTNGGMNWTTQFQTYALNCVDFSGTNTGFAAGINGSIIKTTDGGTTWLPQSSGVTSILRSIEFIDSLTGFACGDGGVILKTTNGGVTSIQQVSNSVPGEFILEQNYPNPFNPTTRIRFSVPDRTRSDNYEVSIFDEMGREVCKMFEGNLKAGTYELTWNADEYPSGIYFCRIYSPGIAGTIRMALLK